MRLIDADALYEMMYRKSFETDDGRQRWDSGLWIRYKVFEEALDEAPTVNVNVGPLVRCRDCIYYEPYKDGGSGGICSNTDFWMPEDGYCSDSELKEDEED